MATPPLSPVPLPSPAPERHRLGLELSPQVMQLLEHVSAVTGAPKAQIVVQAFVEALPALLERSDAIQKRSRELIQAAQQQAGKKR